MYATTITTVDGTTCFCPCCLVGSAGAHKAKEVNPNRKSGGRAPRAAVEEVFEPIRLLAAPAAQTIPKRIDTVFPLE